MFKTSSFWSHSQGLIHIVPLFCYAGFSFRQSQALLETLISKTSYLLILFSSKKKKNKAEGSPFFLCMCVRSTRARAYIILLKFVWKKSVSEILFSVRLGYNKMDFESFSSVYVKVQLQERCGDVWEEGGGGRVGS